MTSEEEAKQIAEQYPWHLWGDGCIPLGIVASRAEADAIVAECRRNGHPDIEVRPTAWQDLVIGIVAQRQQDAAHAAMAQRRRSGKVT